LSRKAQAALIIAVIAVTATVGTYVHDNPSGITRIVDINNGTVAVGENVTIKARIIRILVLLIGFDWGAFLVTDGSGDFGLSWHATSFQSGQVIIARGTVGSIDKFQHTDWVEHVWLFA